MPHILIADDSPVERRLYEALICKHVRGAKIVHATDGAQVLAEVGLSDFDLILTDFQMPKMDGLEVLERVSQLRPGLPVIVMTGCGSETTAIRALQGGAANYLMKTDISHRLVETVCNVLALSQTRHNRRRINGTQTLQTAAFELQSDMTLVTPLIMLLQEQLQSMQLCDDTMLTRIGVALNEALTNAIYHGNLELDSELRQEDESIFYDLAEHRRHCEPYATRRVYVASNVDRATIRYVVRDEGPGFDATSVKDPTDDDNLFCVGGRGLLLIRSFMDEVTHNSQGNEITLVKQLKEVDRQSNVLDSACKHQLA